MYNIYGQITGVIRAAIDALDVPAECESVLFRDNGNYSGRFCCLVFFCGLGG